MDLRIVPARPQELPLFIDFMEEVADWLETRGVKQWRPGTFRSSLDYYGKSIGLREVHLAFLGDDLVGTVRLLLKDAIVWPEVREDDGLYVYNLAVGRGWAGQGLGRLMLEWAEQQARSLGRNYLRLDCFADNEALRCYYEQAGFEDRGVVDARYPTPIGILRLQRFEKRIGME